MCHRSCLPLIIQPVRTSSFPQGYTRARGEEDAPRAVPPFERVCSVYRAPGTSAACPRPPELWSSLRPPCRIVSHLEPANRLRISPLSPFSRMYTFHIYTHMHTPTYNVYVSASTRSAQSPTFVASLIAGPPSSSASILVCSTACVSATSLLNVNRLWRGLMETRRRRVRRFAVYLECFWALRANGKCVGSGKISEIYVQDWIIALWKRKNKGMNYLLFSIYFLESFLYSFSLPFIRQWLKNI